MIFCRRKNSAETKQSKSILNGIIEQDLDLKTDSTDDLKVVTKRAPSQDEVRCLIVRKQDL